MATLLGGSAAAINAVQIPPIRTNLTDPVVTNQTAKEWYFFWKQSADRINTLNGMVAYGNSSDRLDPSLAPDGALYVEQNYGGIIYQNQGGAWHYLAGTMWGTLNPDQRPVGLGPNDAGFAFRSIDTDPNYAPREFLWSGHEWIETTMVLYGLHAARPAADEKTPPRTIYVETDRSVIYQQQANAWHYLAGTMWGTISPDQRPTDLGANDAGFQFRATDTGANSGRMFAWSGSIWVETTPNRYGTHASRLALSAASTWNGTVWIETDRGEASYQLQGSTWYFLAGTMWGTISPDGRPTDLGANDAGFKFRATDQSPREWIWNGSAWVETTSDNPAVLAVATASLTLTTTAQAVPGATLTLARAGRYLVHGIFYFNFSSVDQGNTLIGTASFGPGNLAAMSVSATNVAVSATVGQQWLYTATAGANIFLQAYKSGGTGTSSTVITHTTISAIWLGP